MLFVNQKIISDSENIYLNHKIWNIFILKVVLRWLNYASLELRRGRDHMVVEFITTYVISAYHH